MGKKKKPPIEDGDGRSSTWSLMTDTKPLGCRLPASKESVISSSLLKRPSRGSEVVLWRLLLCLIYRIITTNMRVSFDESGDLIPSKEIASQS